MSSFDSFLARYATGEQISATTDSVALTNSRGKTFLLSLSALEACILDLWAAGEKLESELKGNWAYVEAKYRAALKGILSTKETSAAKPFVESQTKTFLRCLELYAYFRLNLAPPTPLDGLSVLNSKSLDPLYTGPSNEKSFAEWLRNGPKPFAEKSVKSYVGAMKGVLSKHAGKELLSIVNSSALNAIHGKALGSKEVMKLDKDGNGMYGAAFKNYASFLADAALGSGPKIHRLGAAEALVSKAFLILTGNSGTGKTKLAERLAETYRDNDDLEKSGNYAMVAVGADWTDNRSVVGFVNHLREASLENPKDQRPVYQSTPVLDLLLHADQHKDWPHFLILDEMNLSHVERYFADFLSAMEARDGVLRLHSEGPADKPDYRLPRSDGDKIGVPRQLAYPENLFVIGTVNVDETTYMFSPKVLDRAHVIEFEVDPKAIEAFLEKPEPLLPAPRAPEAEAFGFLQLSKDARAIDGGSVEPLPSTVAEKINAHLMAVLRILQRGRFEFAFRTANEVNTYLRVCRQLADDKSAWESGGWKTDLDDEILQKILPRLHGSRARVGNLVGALVCYFANAVEAEALQFFPADGREEAVKTLTDAITLESKPPEFQRCFKKMQTMARVLVEEQFVSFIC